MKTLMLSENALKISPLFIMNIINGDKKTTGNKVKTKRKPRMWLLTLRMLINLKA